MRILLAPGVYVDFINPHTNAGTSSGDETARENVCEGSYNGGMRLFYSKWTTNLGRTLAGGVATSDCTTFTAPAGYQISGFFGRSGTEVDKLGVFYTKVP
jgi:hypothetical protein